jgi:hypothetical protein
MAPFILQLEAKQMRFTMTNTIRNSALALTLLAGVALVSAPALAGSYKHHSDNSWNKSAQNNSYRRHNHYDGSYAYDRSYYGGNAYRNPGYAYYGPGAYYGDGSPYNYGPSRGLSITIR